MEGLWTIEFGSSVGMYGGAVVFLENGKVMGGDSGYSYLGEFDMEGSNLRATIKASPFIADYENVFRTPGELTVEIVGLLTDETHAVAQGHPVGRPDLRLGMKLTKRS